MKLLPEQLRLQWVYSIARLGAAEQPDICRARPVPALSDRRERVNVFIRRVLASSVLAPCVPHVHGHSCSRGEYHRPEFHRGVLLQVAKEGRAQEQRQREELAKKNRAQEARIAELAEVLQATADHVSHQRQQLLLQQQQLQQQQGTGKSRGPVDTAVGAAGRGHRASSSKAGKATPRGASRRAWA